MRVDKTTGIAIILGIGMIFGTFSMIFLPEMETEYNDPWSYQTMRTKLLNSEINLSLNEENKP